MGGYNTFCEILSLRQAGADPGAAHQTPRAGTARSAPSLRRCASALPDAARLASMPARTWPMIPPRWRRRMQGAAGTQKKPSRMAIVPGLLDGLEKIQAITRPCVRGSAPRAAPLGSIVGVACRMTAAARRRSRRSGRSAIVHEGLSPPVGDVHRPGDPGASAGAAWRLRSGPCARPTDRARASAERRRSARRRAPTCPEYLYQEPLRVLRGLAWAAVRQPGARAPADGSSARDAAARTRRRTRGLPRLGQAFVHGPRAVARIDHGTWHVAFPAHAGLPAWCPLCQPSCRGAASASPPMPRTSGRSPAWEKREKIADARVRRDLHPRWGSMPCPRQPRRPTAGKLSLVYHGLDLSAAFPNRPPASRPARDGSDSGQPRWWSSAVGRAGGQEGATATSSPRWLALRPGPALAPVAPCRFAGESAADALTPPGGGARPLADGWHGLGGQAPGRR